MRNSGDGVEVSIGKGGILVHQNIINGAVYFFATRSGREINSNELKAILPSDLSDMFDVRHELVSESYIKCCEIIGLEPFNVEFIIAEEDIHRLRRAAFSGSQYEAEVADDLIKLAMVITNGFEAIGDDYDKGRLIKSVRRRIFHAGYKNRFDVKWYNEVFSKLEDILKGGPAQD